VEITMIHLDREDQRLLTQIDSKPYKFYSLTDLLPKINQLSGYKVTQFESRLNRLNEARIIYKIAIKEKTYYFSPKAETEENN
jgi:hypothetical protein